MMTLGSSFSKKKKNNKFPFSPFASLPKISMSAPFRTSVSLELAITFPACSVVSARLATNWTEVVGIAQVRHLFTSESAPNCPGDLAVGASLGPRRIAQSQKESGEKAKGIPE